MQAILLAWLEGREQKTSREKQKLQLHLHLHLQNAIVTMMETSLKVVCGGADLREKKGVGGKGIAKTNGMMQFC